MSPETYNVVSTVLYVISAVIAFSMFWLGVRQLGKINEQIKEAVNANTISTLGALIEIENQIQSNRDLLAKASVNVTMASEGDLDSARLYFNQCIEMYLNSIERLCFCIIKGHFDTNDMRREYKSVIEGAMNEHKDYYSQTTKYRNTVKIYHQWMEV